jgi:5-methylcytosine-specific restriction endonuclease McrA
MSKYTPRTRVYWDLREHVRRAQPLCWLCGREIDPAAKYPDPWSFSVDHVIAASIRPDLAETLSNMRAAHIRCNRRRQTGTSPARAGGRTRAGTRAPAGAGVESFTATDL